MMDNIPRKSLKKRLTFQFSAFVAAIVIFLTFVVITLFILVLTGNLKTSLSMDVYHVFITIEQRISFLAENTQNFSKNHFIINSLIDPHGRSFYLPKIVKDFSTAQDISAVTIVDFEGNIIHSTLKDQPDYRKTIYLRDVLDVGKPIIQMSDNQKNIIFVEPIEYYQTPQGAIIVEVNLNSIAARALPEDNVAFYKLYSKRKLLFSQNYIEGESYITVRLEAEKSLSYMNRLDIDIEKGVLRKKHLAPVLTALIPLVLIGGTFIVVSIMLAARIGGSISRPILQLCERVKKTNKLDVQKCSPVGTGDELEELAQVFDNRTMQLTIARNQMEEQTKELKDANKQLQREITKQKHMEEKLIEQSGRLLRNNQELEQFLFVASHDLQEPLRKITTFGSLLMSKYSEKLDEKGHNYLERMQKATERMQTLINDLLTYSRVTTKAQPFAPVDLSGVVRDVLSDLELRIEQTGGKVEVGDLPVIDADPLQMRQLLQNLIGNALKFNKKDEAPVVKVHGMFSNGNSAAAENQYYQLTIEDNGIGFDEQYADRIFGVFQRLHGRSEYEGMGIGLSVCKKIVERHGGSIAAKSAPGQGATFIITLPVKQHERETSNV